MSGLLNNPGFYILLATVLGSIGLVYWPIPNIKVVDVYALWALSYVYLALLITPLSAAWSNMPQKMLAARRVLAIAAFYLALLHGYQIFFNQLGGFIGLSFLTNSYLVAVSLGATSLGLLGLLTLGSFDWVVRRLGQANWQRVQWLIYLVGVLVLIHGIMLGNFLSDPQSIIGQVVYGAIVILLWLDAMRLDRWLRRRFNWRFEMGLSRVLVVGLVVLGAAWMWLPQSSSNLGIHGWHIQLAKEAIQNQSQNQTNLPLSLQGDRGLRFTTSMDPVGQILPGQPTMFRFRVNNASNGNPVAIFSKPYEKTMHLIVVNNEMDYFVHLHPEQQDSDFVITTQFPKAGTYRLYLDFQPLGAIEQQMAFRINVGDSQGSFSTQPVDQNLTKVVDGYQVSLEDPKLVASKMSLGVQTLKFTIKDATGQPVTTLKPYLASFGHLVMISQQSYDYIHVHPTNTKASLPDQNGGPVVEFLPVGIYGSFKPGTYRVFGQFNPNGQLIVADFTVKVE